MQRLHLWYKFCELTGGETYKIGHFLPTLASLTGGLIVWNCYRNVVSDRTQPVYHETVHEYAAKTKSFIRSGRENPLSLPYPAYRHDRHTVSKESEPLNFAVFNWQSQQLMGILSSRGPEERVRIHVPDRRAHASFRTGSASEIYTELLVRN